MRHQPVALVHLPHDPLQRHHRLGRVGDDGGQQVRDVLVDRELDHLGVDHDHPQLLRRQPVEQRQDHGVDRHRLARAGGAGDQQMRHAGEVGDDRLAGDVLAQRQRQARAAAGVDVGLQQLAQIDGGAALVGQLDADHVAAGDDGDAHRQRAQRAGDVVGEADHARGAGAGRRLQLVEGDHRAGLGVDDLAAHAEIVEHGLELARGLGQGLRRLAWAGDRLDRRQQVEARQLEARCPAAPAAGSGAGAGLRGGGADGGSAAGGAAARPAAAAAGRPRLPRSAASSTSLRRARRDGRRRPRPRLVGRRRASPGRRRRPSSMPADAVADQPAGASAWRHRRRRPAGGRPRASRRRACPRPRCPRPSGRPAP